MTRVEAPAFAVEELVADARAEGEPLDFLEPLGVLADSLEAEARLTESGRRAVRGALVSSLVTQLRLRRLVAEEPELPRRPIPRPVFVIGLLRTGTTLVHNLLDQHPELRVPHLWELMFPVGTGAGDDEDRRTAEAYVADYYEVAPRLPVVHYIDAHRPDECHRLLGNAFQSMVYEMRFRVPSYAEWLAEQDLTEAYRYHRLQLQSILHRIPGDPVVLKCPFHVWSLDALARAYPEARYVHLHRGPLEVVLSTCSLCEVLRTARSSPVDLAEIGREWLAQVARGIERMRAARRDALAGAPVLDLGYREVVADPIGSVRRICELAEVELSEEAERRMRAYLEDNPQHKHGVHRYSAEQFGLDAEDVTGRFEGYREEYGAFLPA